MSDVNIGDTVESLIDQVKIKKGQLYEVVKINEKYVTVQAADGLMGIFNFNRANIGKTWRKADAELIERFKRTNGTFIYGTGKTKLKKVA
jgi:hypothetical protein